jgi:uncharacterized damage-inducible protein DinB
MTTEHLLALFQRDLTKLAKEINLYENEAQLWVVGDGITNSGGNLCLHLIGNLRTYFGAVLGDSGYIRNREAEFGDKDVPRATLLAGIEAAKADIERVLPSLTAADLEKEYPMVVFKEPMQTGFFILHLATHLGYHLGQVNYHRRLLAR